jgi:hypothetical protein
MTAESDIEKHKAFLLAQKLTVTFVGMGEKITAGKRTGVQALCVGVIHKLPDSLLDPPTAYWDGFNAFIAGQPVRADVAFAKIPPEIFGIKTDVVETGRIVAL